MDPQLSTSSTDDRREFLKKFGKAAIIAPPALTVLLSTSLSSPAIAQSSSGSTGETGSGSTGSDPGTVGSDPGTRAGETPEGSRSVTIRLDRREGISGFRAEREGRR